MKKVYSVGVKKLTDNTQIREPMWILHPNAGFCLFLLVLSPSLSAFTEPFLPAEEQHENPSCSNSGKKGVSDKTEWKGKIWGHILFYMLAGFSFNWYVSECLLSSRCMTNATVFSYHCYGRSVAVGLPTSVQFPVLTWMVPSPPGLVFYLTIMVIYLH